MSISFHVNSIVWFRTSYNDGVDDLTKYRPYLLKEVNEKDKLLVFFPLTSNRTRYKVFISQFAILNRPSCLSRKIYPQSFVNTNRLITVPFAANKHLNFCQSCFPYCLDEKESADILQLHSNLMNYQVTRVREINLIIDDFMSPKS